jgi:hypothetical protein
MVIDRIHDRVPPKSKDGDYWEIARSGESKEEKKRDEDKGRRQRELDAFGESSDFIQLLTKDPRTYKREKIDTARIAKFTFRGVSTHREKAILELDISLHDGTLIRSAQMAISRQEGMKFISRKPGEEILTEPLLQGASYLTVALPQKNVSSLKSPESSPPFESPEVKTAGRLEWYYYLLFGFLGLGVAGLLYIFFMG